MNFYDIDKLKRDENQDYLYNLFTRTFQYQKFDFGNTSVVVNDNQTMRLDVISQNVYSTDDYLDILCSLNGIDNPLNIMEGDVLICPVSDAITSYRLDEVGKSTTPIEINSAEKSSYVDENRKKFVSQNYNITPTSVTEPQDPVKFIEDKIVISK
jgi:hypothetical protein